MSSPSAAKSGSSSMHQEEEKKDPNYYKGRTVEIINLTSDAGKKINHHLAIITDKLTNDGRYPIKIHHLTGEIQQVKVKPINLNFNLTPEQENREQRKLNFLKYSNNARVRNGHGIIIEEILMSLRYSMNCIMGVFRGTYEEFMALDRSDDRIALLNAKMYTMLNIKPSEMGFGMTPDMELAVYIKKMLKMNEDNMIRNWGKMANYKEKDGSGCKLVVRNMARFVESWDDERISGGFWIVKITSKGTLMVNEENQELGNVYLVKGLASMVGEQFPSGSFPVLVQTTLLPVYNFLVYDGVMGAGGYVGPSESRKKEIQEHTEKALREQTIVYCGESASNGLWDSEPPEVNPDVLLNNKKSESKESDERYDLDDDVNYDPTPIE